MIELGICEVSGISYLYHDEEELIKTDLENSQEREENVSHSLVVVCTGRQEKWICGRDWISFD